MISTFCFGMRPGDGEHQPSGSLRRWESVACGCETAQDELSQDTGGDRTTGGLVEQPLDRDFVVGQSLRGDVLELGLRTSRS